MILHAEPRPERVANVDLTNPKQAQDTFAVGITTTTETAGGLKIIPTNEIAFVVGRTDGSAEHGFAIGPRHARALAAKIIEFCDHIEGASQ